jgi:hypothetical protein
MTSRLGELNSSGPEWPAAARPGSRVATVVRAKDDADGMRWGFALDVVEQGIDADGDAITTLIVRGVTEASGKMEKAKPLPIRAACVAIGCPPTRLTNSARIPRRNAPSRVLPLNVERSRRLQGPARRVIE